MEKFRIAAAQLTVDYRDVEHNLASHAAIVREAAGAGCQVVVFPELSVTGHNSVSEILKYAQPVNGPIFEEMHAQARTHNIIVGYGFCESARGTHYNAYAIVGPQGLLGVQRKVHASYDEFFRFRQAYEWAVVDLGFCRIGAAICHDADFFESWRILALIGAEVVLLPHAIRCFAASDNTGIVGTARRSAPESEVLERQRLLTESHPLQLLHDVQARSNAVFGAFADQVGYDGDTSHIGGAYVVGPDGTLIANTKPSMSSQWVSADLDPALAEQARLSPWFTLRKRRPEAYGELTKLL
jgi:predicted amidohydrolase